MGNVIAGFRRMTGLSQSEMGKKLNISEATYRNKEKGRIPFKDYEMELFYGLVSEVRPGVEITDIFFTVKPTQNDETKE